MIISSKVQNVINMIETKDFSKQELINYFNNINSYPDISDIEREELVKVVEKKMRIQFLTSRYSLELGLV